MVTQERNRIALHCVDEDDPFTPLTDDEIVIEQSALRDALQETKKELLSFANQINKLCFKYQVNSLSDYLIGEHNYS